MKNTLIFIVVLLVLSAGSCEKFGEKKYVVWLENKSGVRLYNTVGTPGQGTAGIYPDTSLPLSKPIFSEVLPQSTGYIIYGSQKIEKIFELLSKDTLSVYVFNADTVDRYDWNTVRTQNRMLRRYDLSLQDLKIRNWLVTYP